MDRHQTYRHTDRLIDTHTHTDRTVDLIPKYIIHLRFLPFVQRSGIIRFIINRLNRILRRNKVEVDVEAAGRGARAGSRLLYAN